MAANSNSNDSIASRLPVFMCDASKKKLEYGVDWFHKVGANMDLCKEELEKLSAEEQKDFLFVNSIEALAQVHADASRGNTTNVGELARMGNIIGLSTMQRLGDVPDDYDSASAKGLKALQELLEEDSDDENEDEIKSKEKLVERAKAVYSGASPLLLLVVGDKGVGKSSLMWAWKHSLPIGTQSEVPAVMPVVVTGPERAVSNKLKMMCVDTAGVDPGQKSITELSISDKLRRSFYTRCHALMLVIDGTESHSLRRVQDFWLSELIDNGLDPSVPVFVVANKMDLPVSSTREHMEAHVQRLMAAISAKFTNPFWMISSANRVDQITGGMKRVQCSVVFPPSLVVRKPEALGEDGSLNVNNAVDPKSKPNTKTSNRQKKKQARAAQSPEAQEMIRQLKSMGMKMPLFRALAAIFQRADEDQDGLLNDAEITHLQKLCYDEVRSLSEIKAEMDKTYGASLVSTKGLTFPAFLMMMMLATMQGRTDLVWRLLFAYGYDYDSENW